MTDPSIQAAREPLAGHRELLRERAERLARVPRHETAAALTTAVLFALGEERYALAAEHVAEVAVLRDLTPLPGAPAPLHGLTQWQGEVLTVLDLRGVLGVRVRGITDLQRLIVVAAGRRRFGFLADRASELIAIDATRIHAHRAGEEPTPLIAGITDDAVLVIDADALIRLHTAPERTLSTGGTS